MNFTNEEIIIFLIILFLFFHVNDRENFEEIGDYDPDTLNKENPYKVPYEHNPKTMTTPYSNIPIQERQLVPINDNNSIMPITSDINKMLKIQLNKPYRVLTSTNQTILPINSVITFRYYRDKYVVYNDKNKLVKYNFQRLYISNNSINYDSPFVTLKTNNPNYELEISLTKI